MSKNDLNSIGILLLAAGGSSRMGKPKLAERFNNLTLLEIVIHELEDIKARSKVVILGANMEIYYPLVSGSGFEITVNEKWTDGISTSIRVGVEHLEKQTKAESVLIILADMVLVKSRHFNKLMEVYRKSGKGIVASDYGLSIGPPVIFNKRYFNELKDIDGDRGAKDIILKHRNDLETVSLPDGLIDIDTEDDLQLLRGRG